MTAASSSVGGVACSGSHYPGGSCLCGLKLPSVKELSWVKDRKVEPLASGTIIYGAPRAFLTSKGVQNTDISFNNNKDLILPAENESTLLQIVLGSKRLNDEVAPFYAAVSYQDKMEKQIELDSPLLDFLASSKREQKFNSLNAADDEDSLIVVQKTYVYVKPK